METTLSEIAVHKEFDLNQAISDIRFYYNLCRLRGGHITVLISQKETASANFDQERRTSVG